MVNGQKAHTCEDMLRSSHVGFGKLLCSIIQNTIRYGVAASPELWGMQLIQARARREARITQCSQAAVTDFLYHKLVAQTWPASWSEAAHLRQSETDVRTRSINNWKTLGLKLHTHTGSQQPVAVQDGRPPILRSVLKKSQAYQSLTAAIRLTSAPSNMRMTVAYLLDERWEQVRAGPAIIGDIETQHRWRHVVTMDQG